MKKIVVFLTLMLSLGLVGCGSRVAKEGKAEAVNTGVEDKVKVNEEVDNSIVQLSNLIDEKKYDDAKVLI